ncbi:MAG: hypothetical protein K2I05_09405 [Mailhella sp.]|nr:hypothetical protein [Mailhella sp.]
MEEEEFWDLYHNDLYKEQPHLLAEFYYKRLNEMHEAYLSAELAKLKNQKVWVFGGGSAFQNKKHLLKDVRIEGILMDFPNAPAMIDNIPVYSPELAFSKKLAYPLVIVAKRENINTMYKKIISQYHYSNANNVILCADLPIFAR